MFGFIGFKWFYNQLSNVQYIIDKIANIQTKNHNFRSNNVLASCYLTYKIGGDLFSTANTRHSRETEVMIQVIKAYVMSLAVFDHLINKNCEATKKFPRKTYHLVHLEEKKKNILHWLNGFLFINVEKDLKVSEHIFSLSLSLINSHLLYLLHRNFKLNKCCNVFYCNKHTIGHFCWMIKGP